MKRLRTMLTILPVVLAVSACNHAAENNNTSAADPNAEQSVRNTETRWNQDIASKDPDKWASYYADDAVLMVAGAPAAIGRQAIRNALQPMTSDPNMSLKFQSSRVVVANSGDLAYTQGTYTLTLTDPQTRKIVHDHGNYVTDYRRQPDGTWKAVADIATSDVPPPPAATLSGKSSR